MIPLERDQLPALAAYKTTGTARVRSGDRDIQIERRYEPELAVRPNCTFWQTTRATPLCDGRELHTPLDYVDFEPDRLRFRFVRPRVLHGDLPGVTRTPEGHRIVEVAHVRDAMLWLHGFKNEGWVPRWGLGVTVLGPAQLVSINVQYRPTTWLALELGGMPIVPSGWTGARALLPALGPVRPFVGGFVSAEVHLLRDRWWLVATGGRIGLDIALGSAQRVLSVEFDVMHYLGGTGGYFHCDLDDAVCAWGGLTYSILW
jgi:hypothetical protein